MEYIAFNPNATMGVSVGHDGIARVWRVADGSVIYRLETGSIGLLGFLPNSNRMAIVRKSTGATQSTKKAKAAPELATGVNSDLPTRKGVAAGERPPNLNSDKISIWDIASGSQLLEIASISGAAISCFAFSADGNRLAVADVTGQIRLWNVESEPASEKSATDAGNP